VSIDIGKSPLLNFVGHEIIQNDNLSVEEQTNQWAKYIRNHSTVVDTYTCDKCHTVMKNVSRVETLKMLREIIVCALDCFSVNGKQTQWYPLELKFLSTNGRYLRYKLVAQIEHSGSYSPVNHTSSGHYWARCLRISPGQQKPEWKCLNDSSVSAASYQLLSSTHMIAYVLVSND